MKKAVAALCIALLFLVACNPEELLLEEPATDDDISYIDIEDVEAEAEEPAVPSPITGSTIAIDETVEETPREEPEEEAKSPAQEYDKLITVEEGGLVKIPARATDPDGDEVKISFAKPLNENGEWQTKEGDAGEYYVTITASDGKTTVKKTVKIVVEEKNQAPRIKPLPDVTIKVGDTIRFEPEVEDPNGDEVEINYSGWMDSASYKATKEDLGEHEVVITASDGRLKDKKFVRVTVVAKNNAPVIGSIGDITIYEGDTIQLKPQVEDPDGDEVKVTYSGWMKGDTYTTTYEDEGMHQVIITASDGELTDVEKITITVKDRNREPELVIPLG